MTYGGGGARPGVVVVVVAGVVVAGLTPPELVQPAVVEIVNEARSPFAPIASSEIVPVHLMFARAPKATVNLPAPVVRTVRTSFVVPDRRVTPTCSPGLKCTP